MRWRWWYWLIILAVTLSAAAWVILAVVWQTELPARQPLPILVEPPELIGKETVTVELMLRPDPECHLLKRWWMVDASGAVVLSDSIMAAAGNRNGDIIPIRKEYVVPSNIAPGRARFYRRLTWNCNLLQAVTQPGIDLEPLSVKVRDRL